MQLDLYDLSRLIYNQFREMRITSRNLDYMNALILLSLYENSSFLENLKVVLNETPEENLDDNYLALGLKRYLTTNELSDLYSDKINDLKSPLMRFFFLSSNLKFANLDESSVEEKKEILVDPIYLFYLSENFNLIQSYIYYIQLSEEYYTLNEFDLYFVNKYLIDNEYLKNEFIKKKEFTRFVKSKINTTKNGKLEVKILKGQESFRIKSFIQSNAWVILPSGKSKFKKGQIIDCFFLNLPNKIFD